VVAGGPTKCRTGVSHVSPVWIHGATPSGAEPGEATAAALDRIFSRITLIGAAYLVLVCLVPEILVAYMGVPFYFGGASLLIVVCTVLDLDDELRAAGMRKSRG